MKLATDQAIKQWYTEQNIYSAKQGKLFSRLISWKLWLIGLVQWPEHLFYPEYMCPPVSLLLSNNKLASLFLECKSRFKVCYQFNKVVQCNTIVTHNESIPLMVLKLCSVVFKILGSIKVLISFSFFKFLFCLLFIYIMIFFSFIIVVILNIWFLKLILAAPLFITGLHCPLRSQEILYLDTCRKTN